MTARHHIGLSNPTRPTGIAWKREGDEVLAVVLAVNPDGTRETITTVHYTPEQAAQVAGQLLSAIGARQ